MKPKTRKYDTVTVVKRIRKWTDPMILPAKQALFIEKLSEDQILLVSNGRYMVKHPDQLEHYNG